MVVQLIGILNGTAIDVLLFTWTDIGGTLLFAWILVSALAGVEVTMTGQKASTWWNRRKLATRNRGPSAL